MPYLQNLIKKLNPLSIYKSIVKNTKCANTDKLVRVINGKTDPTRRWQIVPASDKPYQSFIIQGFRPRLQNCKVTMDTSPPVHVRGMKELDKSQFTKKINVPSIKVPKKTVGKASSLMRNSFLKIPGIKCVVDVSDDGSQNSDLKVFLIDPLKHPDIESFQDNVKCSLQNLDVDLNSWKLVEIEMTYENWNYDDILKAILPEDSNGIAGFSMIGHICHLNLRDEVTGFKKIIGDVLLDKVAAAKTVVNKLNTIDNTFRNFQMEVLAGDADFITTVKEDGLQYQMDFSKVYWNSRLGTEHRRIVSHLQRGDMVFDVFAGIGPFAIPAAKKKCDVFANDLNPESYKWLMHNVKLNKIKTEVSCSNLDGRQFVREIVKPNLLKQFHDPGVYCDKSIHIVMNLPALAIEFLDVFRHLYSDVDYQTLPHFKSPIVHCYCFSKNEDPIRDAQTRVEQTIKSDLPLEGTTVRLVRNVAPNKEMLCVTFPLLKEVLFSSIQTSEIDDEPQAKKFKEDDKTT